MANEQYKPHWHKIVNVNDLHRYEQEHSGINQRIALRLTHLFQTAWAFWLLAIWIAVLATIGHYNPLPWVLLLALASTPPLLLMVVVIIGQSVIGRHQELQADETYEQACKTYQDTESLMKQYSVLMEEVSQIKNTLAFIYNEQLNHSVLLAQSTTSQEVGHE
jgi:uncharacterized membrane protein